MHIIPNQYFGLGDIIWCQTLVHLIAPGMPVVWGVLPQFVEQLNRAYPHIKFVDWRTLQIDYNRRDQYECDIAGIGKCTVLPLRWADAILKVPYNQCMRAKYDLYGQDFNRWREKAMWVRDETNEWVLRSILEHENHLVALTDITLINRTFGSDGKLKVDIPCEGIEMMARERISLFDWAPVFAGAREIHTVSTSIVYILEMLELKRPVHLYPRKPHEYNFDNVSYLLTPDKYILHV